nr:immunoglobulin heavy chain junction region [Mus musculus]
CSRNYGSFSYFDFW